MDTINAYIFGALERHRDLTMQVRRDRSWTYAEAARAIAGVAGMLRERGVAPDDRVAILAENSPQWFHAYMGVLAVGGVVVPRGEDTSERELHDILEHAGCKLAFVASERAAKRVPDGIDTILLDALPDPADPSPPANRKPEDLAVILYTSGTTGRPKGVMLEHGNIAHNIRVVPGLVDMRPGDRWVSVLPSWHTFEQTVELCGFAVGCTTIYSDKRRLRSDLSEHRPEFFASVPRIWETIYEGVRAEVRKKGRVAAGLLRAVGRGTHLWRRGNPLGLPLHLLGKVLFYGKIAAAVGGNLKCAVSGGGYLPLHIDEFFDAAGVTLLIGYGLTETAPVVALRDRHDNVLGTIGRAVAETEIRVGKGGTFQVRGPQVMRGYYRDEELTRAVLDEDGWFDTGDLGRITEKGDLVFVGRAKETIVLSGGENIEPEPIEQRLVESPLVRQAMLVGQDRKVLGALLVPDPDAGATEETLRELLKECTGKSGGFRSFEAVNRFAVVDEAFSPENGFLTPTLKMRRNVIADHYRDVIDSLYS